MAAEARIIKRYANRKLYDTEHSKYVTLDQIAEMIRLGDEVTIIDNKTKEDLTTVTLAQIIFEEEKKQRSFLPLQAMRNIIQHGGEQVSQLVSSAQKRVSNILPHKHRDEEAAEAVSEAPPPEELAAKKKLDIRSLPEEFRDWIQQSQRAVDEWQRKIDDRIRNVVEGISPFHGLQSDVKILAARIAELENRLEAIMAEQKTQGSTPAD